VTRLSRSFYARGAESVARDLLGKVLVRATAQGLFRGRIVEVEAYTGRTDPGSHAYRGLTPRNEVMFGPAGFLYVYFTYGIHFCMNVVTEQEGTAGAVLIRALEPLEALDRMTVNRGRLPVRDLCNGPGKLCQALGVTRADNGTDLEGSVIWIEDDGFPAENVGMTTRVGLTAGGSLPLRFFLKGNPFVSRGRPSSC
jgi:DNA-3-methyladenine glycosylase